MLGTAASAQEGSPAANAPAAVEQGAPPAEQPSRRERRRKAESAAETVAATPGAEPTAAADSAAPAEPEVVCKNIKPIGSRVARRICATEEQWAASGQSTRADAQEGMRQVRDRSGITGGVGAGPASLGTPAMQ